MVLSPLHIISVFQALVLSISAFFQSSTGLLASSAAFYPGEHNISGEMLCSPVGAGCRPACCRGLPETGLFHAYLDPFACGGLFAGVPAGTGHDFYPVAARGKACRDEDVRNGRSDAEVAGSADFVLVFPDEEHPLPFVRGIKAQVPALYAQDVMRYEGKLPAFLSRCIHAGKFRNPWQDDPAASGNAPGSGILHLPCRIRLKVARHFKAVVTRSRRKAFVEPVGRSVRLQVDERKRKFHVVAQFDEMPDAVVQYRKYGTGIRFRNRRVVAGDLPDQLLRIELLIGDAPVAVLFPA